MSEQQDREFFSYILHRSEHFDLSQLPFCVRTVGQRFESIDYKSRFTAHDFYEFSWTIGGYGTLLFEDSCYDVNAGDIMIIPIGLKRQYICRDSFWNMRWFTATGDFFNQLLQQFSVTPAPFHAGTCPELDFIQLENAIKEMSFHGLQMACSTAFKILIQACTGHYVDPKQNPLTTHCIQLIDKNLEYHDLNVDWLAENCQCHRSFLSRQFKKEMNISPSEYIAQKRLQKAMTLLNSERKMNIRTIAKKCGFYDPDYFSRFFRKQTGKQPKEFRLEDGH